MNCERLQKASAMDQEECAGGEQKKKKKKIEKPAVISIAD